MGTTRRAIAALVLAGVASGCFGYNRSAKRWAYAGDTVLIVGGGGAIAGDLLTREACMPTPSVPCSYEAPVSGVLVAGAVLVVAGLVGMIVNATRPTVKTSR
jgi:ABC-type Mn2+/Zn2+ transport system permease subunit